jgi:hypothetical protein
MLFNSSVILCGDYVLTKMVYAFSIDVYAY